MMNNKIEIVKKFNEAHQIICDVDLRTLDLASEVGEVCKLAFMARIGKKVDLAKWEDECVDVLY